MKRLRFSQRFVAELKKITEHITKDKPQSLGRLRLLCLPKSRAYLLCHTPIANDECVRELIFKGFVVVFVISDSIDVLGIISKIYGRCELLYQPQTNPRI
ncbi:type II toxin-antitoxin system RelE/ParE family toxin [Helicobacter canis]|uniref:Type II toxin-antitoxin system RelE/ParE family toxin n=1 Tax=Helicobacter canis TaxID=29419 RepID=A0A5M9QL42_9HELI|nr:type II toxin-antitoxin system RelE/ParE family toxin [Helicobacter canis]KAA8707675.1 type II toxin-antitoxin system RelE/ParE family toxin [Helicobacter canis]